MYHLAYNKCAGFIVIDDITYSTSAWSRSIPAASGIVRSTTNWDRENSLGKPIEQTINALSGTLVVASSEKPDFHMHYTAQDFPELLL